MISLNAYWEDELLSVGRVLHEAAHHVMRWLPHKRGVSAHGPPFTTALDVLIAEYNRMDKAHG